MEEGDGTTEGLGRAKGKLPTFPHQCRVVMEVLLASYDYLPGLSVVPLITAVYRNCGEPYQRSPVTLGAGGPRAPCKRRPNRTPAEPLQPAYHATPGTRRCAGSTPPPTLAPAGVGAGAVLLTRRSMGSAFLLGSPAGCALSRAGSRRRWRPWLRRLVPARESRHTPTAIGAGNAVNGRGDSVACGRPCGPPPQHAERSPRFRADDTRASHLTHPHARPHCGCHTHSASGPQRPRGTRPQGLFPPRARATVNARTGIAQTRPVVRRSCGCHMAMGRDGPDGGGVAPTHTPPNVCCARRGRPHALPFGFLGGSH